MCAPREVWIELIEGEKYLEQLIGKGLVLLNDGNSVFELFSSPDGETFTVLLTGPRPHPQGAYLESCMIVSGRYWQRIPFAAPGSSM